MLAAVAVVLLCGALAAPARADDRHHWRGHERHERLEHHAHYRPYYYHEYHYAPDYYDYAPAPVYVPPPEPSVGLNLVFPFHID